MIAIRKCQLEDERKVLSLVSSILNKEFPKEAQAYPLTDLEHISESYGKLGEAFFVAVQDGEIVGTIGIKREDDRMALVRRLFVASDVRKSGLGTKLIERAIEFCKEVGYEEMIIKTTSSMERAIQLCQKKGFVSRARLNIGPVELMKLTLHLKGKPLSAKGSAA